MYKSLCNGFNSVFLLSALLLGRGASFCLVHLLAQLLVFPLKLLVLDIERVNSRLGYALLHQILFNLVLCCRRDRNLARQTLVLYKDGLDVLDGLLENRTLVLVAVGDHLGEAVDALVDGLPTPTFDLLVVVSTNLVPFR